MASERSFLRASAHRDSLGKMDALLDSAQITLHSTRGAKQGLGAALREIVNYQGAEIGKAIDRGELDLEQAKLVKDHLTKLIRAVETVENRATQAIVQAEGKVAGLTAGLEAVKKLFDVEDQKYRAQLQAEQAESGGGPDNLVPMSQSSLKRAPGMRPVSLAAQRRAEAAPEPPPSEQPAAPDQPQTEGADPVARPTETPAEAPPVEPPAEDPPKKPRKKRL